MATHSGFSLKNLISKAMHAKRKILMIATAALVATVPAKLPYQKGEQFIVVQGYNSPPTHIKKDAFALDFSQNGCDAYGKTAVAAEPGTVILAQQEGYDGGYGTQILIRAADGVIARYAHLIPDTIAVALHDVVRQGQPLAKIGNTGLVAGAACPTHPGTHIHFAMYTVAPDGTYLAYDPEPISGYTNMTAGKWYLSDNDESDIAGQVLGASIEIPATASSSLRASTTSAATTTTTTMPVSPKTSPTSSYPPVVAVNNPGPSGGVAVSPAPPESEAPAQPATTTPPVATDTILFSQPIDDTNSAGSWYDDNWYELGGGFSGTLYSLTLEGKVSDVDFSNSHVELDEFKDSGYQNLIQQFVISDNAPFTPQMATATFGDLSILLKPYFYYRLDTNQDYQNRSVILAGTNTTGTAMYDNFVYGIGRVESYYPFMPFMTMVGLAPTSTPVPPPLTTPGAITFNFDPLKLQLGISWSTSTDPDWPENPLHYDVEVSTSSDLGGTTWNAFPNPMPVTLGNSYFVGIRAADNGYSGYSCAGSLVFSFASSSPQLMFEHPYRWVMGFFGVNNPLAQPNVEFYGTATNTAGGLFTDPSLVNAKFTMNGNSGVLFSN